jgi:hypothetical protein
MEEVRMFFPIPEVRVGDPLSDESLFVFPLFITTPGSVDYVLAEEAISNGTVSVKEVSESGSVPELFVENSSDERILFIEGDELKGAKQNRILNTSLLIPARSKMRIPVSCVERGRWRYSSRGFAFSGSHSPSTLKFTMKKSVAASLKKGRGHFSDQGEIWRKVNELHSKQGFSSPTEAMSDVFDALKRRIDARREKLHYVEGASGLAVATGGRILALDFFDKPETCRKVWNRLLSGVVMETLGEAAFEKGRTATIGDVERLLDRVKKTEWKKVEPVGEGEDYRAESGNDQRSILAVNDVIVHGNVLRSFDRG